MKDNMMERITISGIIKARKVVTIFMVNGFQMHGYIREQDDVSVRVEVDDKNLLLYKCNISTIEYKS